MLIVGNGLLVTLGDGPRVIHGGAVAAEGGAIAAIGSTEEIKSRYPGAEFLDARGALIMPGLVNVHTHAYGAFARGISLGGRPAKTFLEVLRSLWWKLDRALTLDDVHVSGLLGLVDCLKNGTTTVFDHHASPYAIAGSLDEMAKAARAVGVRACLCYEVSDRDGPGRATERGRTLPACFSEGKGGISLRRSCRGHRNRIAVARETVYRFRLLCDLSGVVQAASRGKEIGDASERQEPLGSFHQCPGWRDRQSVCVLF